MKPIMYFLTFPADSIVTGGERNARREGLNLPLFSMQMFPLLSKKVPLWQYLGRSRSRGVQREYPDMMSGSEGEGVMEKWT